MIENIIGIVVMCMTMCYCFDKILDEKINYKNFYNWLYLFLFGLILYYNWKYNISYIKVLFSLLAFIGVNYLLHKKEPIENVLASGTIYMLLMISAEIIFSLTFSIIFYSISIQDVVDKYFGSMLVNISICLIVLFLIDMKLIYLIYEKLKSLMQYTRIIFIMSFIIFGILTFNILSILTYTNDQLIIKLMVNLIIALIYIFVIIKTLLITSKYDIISSKYNNALDILKEYEKMIDVYKVNNHENKNQLLTVRNMILSNEKNISNFIDNIVDNKINDDEKVLFSTSNIPEGGLRAIIYSKLLEAKKLKIKTDLKVDYSLRKIVFNSNDSKLVLDICKIVGVFLDNAIYASIEMKNDAYIKIELYLEDDNFNISIKNKFKGVIEIDKIDKIGYTTKGGGHGYGLSLAKEIISKNKILSNEREIRNNVFIQRLKVKIVK